MIVTVEYSSIDLARRCYGCANLELTYADVYGECKCKKNKVKNRYRSATDKACAYKSNKERRGTQEGEK